MGNFTQLAGAGALITLWAGATMAQSPLTAAEFEAYTTGKTLFFAQDGQNYGIEAYKSDRRVQWSFLDQQCIDGRWYPDGPAICFVYEDGPWATPQCWLFFQEGAGLTAQFVDENGPGNTLYETRQSDEPMRCLGPLIGS